MIDFYGTNLIVNVGFLISKNNKSTYNLLLMFAIGFY